MFIRWLCSATGRQFHTQQLHTYTEKLRRYTAATYYTSNMSAVDVTLPMHTHRSVVADRAVAMNVIWGKGLI